ncbi:T9SS type A sorting domain-containing protein [Cryomorphaceae bacterium 1068]|nr:T9SS type A sorting domain-containing protein [Cryomorphaceae bacterium 1068]
MVRNLQFILTPLILSTTFSLSAQNSGCEGFRTQTQGGWGSSANGNNPGAYRDAHFDDAFPDGITLGCDYVAEFETSANVEAFLPSGGTARSLESDLLNPTDYGNVLAGQLLALTLSVGFDANDADFSTSSILLGDLIVNSGTFEGYSVSEILEFGNQILGGCETDFSASQINSVLSSINENYVDGSSNSGVLDCPEEELSCALDLSGMSTECTQNNTYFLTVNITGANGSFQVVSNDALSIEPAFLCFSEISDNPSENVINVSLEFPLGADYNFSVVSAENPDCDASANVDCQLDNISGVAPECCTLTIECDDADQIIYSCISDIPDADTNIPYTSEGCGEVSIQVSETTQGNGCQSNPLVLTRTYTVTNGTDMQSCTQTFMVIDDEVPVITCPPDQNATCSAFIEPDQYATATDNCDDEVTITYQNGPSSGCGLFIRTWIATDDCGNSAYCYQNVYVDDTTGPQIAGLTDVIVDCGTNLDPFFVGGPFISDACSEFEFFYTDSEPVVEECSTTITRIWTATDACGNTSTAEQQITETDLSAPVLYGVPGNQFFQCEEIPEVPEVYAVDFCSGDTVDVEMEETIADEGCRKTIQRTFTATDNCDNSNSISYTITIEDTQGPQLTCPEDVLLTCGDGNIDPAETGQAEALDACSENFVTITFDDSEYQANTCPPRIIRTWTAVDTCGNASNCVQLILFDDQEAPSIDCLDDITINCSEATTDPEFTGTPAAEDACSEVTVTYADGPFDGSCPASFVRTWEASDACGNASYCYQVITVISEEAPTLVCPPEATVSCGASFEPYNTGMATVTDQCLDVTLTYTDTDLIGDCEKQFTRTWIATDVCGNTSSCDQLIIVVDQMNPFITCPPTATVECGGNTDPSVLGEATAVDYCSAVEVTYADEENFDSCTPSILRTWTAVDVCGNTHSCVQVIEIIGGGVVDITCPDDVTIACDADTDPVSTGTATVIANCADVALTYVDSILPADETSGGDCGQLRTQTQGGWGSRANGNNPGTYRDANFEAAFPEGLVIGCEYTLTLTSSAAVEAFLPNGGPVTVLTEDLVDPTDFRTVLAGQLVAATLSVGFDANDEDFSESVANLGDYTLSSGPMVGLSVSEVIAEANAFIGGCESAYSGSELNTTLTAINESYVDGNGSSGTLNCPETTGTGDCLVIFRTWTATDLCGNAVSCTQVITQSSELDELLTSDAQMMAYPSPATSTVNFTMERSVYNSGTLTIANLSGIVVHTETVPSGVQRIELDLSGFVEGVYVVNFRSKSGAYTTKFVKM